MHILEPHLIMDLYLVGLQWNPGIYIFNKQPKRFSYTQWGGKGEGPPEALS